MLKTRVGKLTLQAPKVRESHFSTDLFARYHRSEQALPANLMEMVISGVSTRKVRKITEEMCGTSFSKSTVSDLCKRLQPELAAKLRIVFDAPDIKTARELLKGIVERHSMAAPKGIQRLEEGAVLMEQDEAWSMGRKHFDMTAYWGWKAGQQRETARKAASEVS